MSKWFGLPLTCLLVSGVARGQDELIKEFAPTDVEKFIKEVINTSVEKKTESPGNRVLFQTPDGHFDIEFLGEPNKTLMFLYAYQPARKATLEKLNEWNNRAGNHSRASVKDGKVVLTGALGLGAGITMKQLKAHYERLQQERKGFEEFTNPPKGAVGRLRDDLSATRFPALAGPGGLASMSFWPARSSQRR